MGKKKIPSTYVIIFILLVICAILTWIIPGGEFVTSPAGEVSFRSIESSPQSWQILTSIYDGFVKQSGIILFILVVGGAFQLLNSTGAVDWGISSFIRRAGGHSNIILAAIAILFSAAGAIFGMSEETIPFVGLVLPLMLSMGYNNITAVLVVYVSANIGFSSAFLNPFTTGIAQEMASLPLFSGMGYRIFCWLLFTALTTLFITIYASRIKRSRAGEVGSEAIASGKENSEGCTDNAKHTKHKAILLLLGVSVVALVIGVIEYQWYIAEISALFLAMGIASGIAAGYDANKISDEFIKGAKDILSAAFVVGMASGIIIILQNGKILDTILYATQSSLGESGKIGSLSAMYGIEAFINLFLPSATAKAAITIPILAPFSDMIGVSRQALVLAFQFGDGFTNMITPTSGVLLAALAMAKVEYTKWFHFIWKWVVLLLILGLLLLIPTVLFEIPGF